MKTIGLLCLAFVVGIVFTSCSKDEQDMTPVTKQQPAVKSLSHPNPEVLGPFNWTDNFVTARSVEGNWDYIGSDQPQWVSFAFDRFGLLLTNGHYPEGSYAVSKRKIGDGSSYSIETEVYINMSNPRGAILIPEFGITRDSYLPTDPGNIQRGLSMRLISIGNDVPEVPSYYWNKTFIEMTALVNDRTLPPSETGGTYYASSDKYAFQADNTSNGWHTMKIVVNRDRQVHFYLDGRFIWSPKVSVDQSLLKDKNIMIGFSSQGNTGSAYHDWVSVRYKIASEL